MEFGVLGQLIVTADDVDRTPRGQRSRDLLAVLLLRPDRAVAPDVLLDLVWGEEGARLDVSVVHTQVARLRRAVGSDQVVTTPTGYRLVAPRTDAVRFHALLDEARRAVDPHHGVELLDRARSLWRGPRPFADVSERIVAGESARLSDARLAADEFLVELLLSSPSRDDVVRALGLARDLVDREPLRERTYELAMLAAARLDEQVEALAIYDDLRHLLREELGVDPGRSVQQLHARVLGQDTGLLLPRSEARAAAPRVAAPPLPATGLIGREADLKALLDLVARRRVVVVTGPGGVGKTRLVLEVADVLAGEREVCFVDLATVEPRSAPEVVEAAATALGLQVGSDADGAALAAALEDRSLLVIIDEAEHEPAGVADLVGVVAARCPRVTVLATSRAPLGVVGEANVPLATLALPPEGATPAEVVAAPAVRLLVERLHDHTPSLDISREDVGLLGSYARQLDGLPLALELVAAYAGSRSVGDLAELLAAPLDLAAADVGRSPRHRSLRETVRWTVERLPAGQRLVLGRLGVFAGPFDLQAARHVVGDDCGPPDAIDALVRGLVRESLLQVERTGDVLRFRMLRTVHDLARELLTEDEDHAGPRARHRAWFAAMRGGCDLTVIDDVRHHYDDHLAALRSALGSGDGAAAVALLLRMGRWWEAQEMAAPAKRWIDRVLAELPLDPADEARARALRGTLTIDHDPAGAREDLLAAVPVLVAEQDGEGVALAQIALAIDRTMSGRPDDAIAHAEEAVAAARRWQPARLRLALSILAAVSADRRPELAEQVAAEALALLMDGPLTDDAPGVAANVAWTLFTVGRGKDALGILDRVIAAMDPEVVPAYLRTHLGWARLLVGDGGGALECFAGALVPEGSDLSARWHADVLTGAGCALAMLRHPDAEELLGGAEELAARTDYVLAGWQAEAVAAARSSLAGRTAPWVAGRAVTGRRLAEIIASVGS